MRVASRTLNMTAIRSGGRPFPENATKGYAEWLSVFLLLFCGRVVGLLLLATLGVGLLPTMGRMP